MKIEDKKRMMLATKLSKHSMFFRTIHDLSQIVYNEKCPAAAQIVFDKNEAMPIRMEINPTIWNELSEDEQLFLVAHECLHIVFSHMGRFKTFLNEIDEKDAKKREQKIMAWNKGVDVSINEMLVEQFGFNRDKLKHPIMVGGCFLDTVWPNESVPSRKSSDFYVNKIMQDQTEENEGQSSGQCFDSHDGFAGEGDGEEAQEYLDQMINASESQEFLRKLSGEQQAEIKENKDQTSSQARGTNDGGSWREIIQPKPPKKRKWEKVIAHWVRQAQKEKIDLFERWEAGGGRYSMIRSEKTHLPFEKWMIDDNNEKTKVNLLFFLDTSGSCISYGERFFKAARTIPTDRFNVNLACFDTRVFPTNLKENKIYGGGGTSFHILEEYALSLPVYPDAIFVISDGYGNAFQCKHPSRWHWFLTPSNTTNCIPKNSKIHMLSDYE